MVGVNHRLCMIARMVIYMLRVEPDCVLFSDASVLIEGAVTHIILFNVLVQRYVVIVVVGMRFMFYLMCVSVT